MNAELLKRSEMIECPDSDREVDCPFEVTGVAIQVHPDRLNAVCAQLALMRGVETHAIDSKGALVITIEELNGEKIALDTLSEINRIAGVLSTSMVYHHAETESR